MNIQGIFLGVIASSVLTGIAFAAGPNDGVFLDPPYSKVKRKAQPFGIESLKSARRPEIQRRSDTLSLIKMQTPVRNQSARGTCSIFSATALVESLLRIQGRATERVDLSEEWLEYLAVRSKGVAGDGSNSPRNFQLIASRGMPNEETLRYIPETWETVTSSALATARCGMVPAKIQKNCLFAHHDPRFLDAPSNTIEATDSDFVRARDEANAKHMSDLNNLNATDTFIPEQGDVKDLLDKGIPVVLDIDFYYGAWNHSKAEKFGLTRDLMQWASGTVGYPETGSLDEEVSRKEGAGHSVLIVGYDDFVQVTSQVKMTDGSVKPFTHHGVYYFKNSWGTTNFGTRTTINGQVFPGYGMITQDYAKDFGQFFKLPLK